MNTSRVAVMQTERQELLSFELFHHYCYFREQRPSLKPVKQINRQNTQQQHKYALLRGGKTLCWMVGQARTSKRNTPFHLFMSKGLANRSSSPRCIHTCFISVIEYHTALLACHLQCLSFNKLLWTRKDVDAAAGGNSKWWFDSFLSSTLWGWDKRQKWRPMHAYTHAYQNVVSVVRPCIIKMYLV